MWRGQSSDIPNDDARQRYIRKLVDQRRRQTTPPPDPEIAPDGWVRIGITEDGPVFIPELPPPPRLVAPTIPANVAARFDRLRAAMVRMEELMNDIPRWSPVPGYDVAGVEIHEEEMPMFQVPRGGIRYGEVPTGWDISDYRKQDPREGEEVYVYDLLPGARVYVLEDVFTVERVELHATPPTVWLKELPTSPLYFTEDEYIYLANETEDQP